MSEQHYTEVDLLETYYKDAASAAVVGAHLSGCQRCTMTLARLRIKMMTSPSANCATVPVRQPLWGRLRVAARTLRSVLRRSIR